MSEDREEPRMSDESNVTPMIPIHRCASCGELVEHDKRFEPESHGATCRQPEIRMRRLEARVYYLEQLASEHWGITPESTHGQSTEDKQPDTKRSAFTQRLADAFERGHNDWAKLQAADTGGAHPGTIAAKPERQAPDGAEPARDPERDA